MTNYIGYLFVYRIFYNFERSKLEKLGFLFELNSSKNFAATSAVVSALLIDIAIFIIFTID